MLLTLLVGVLLSFFSTIVMSYVAMATPIGPWIAPTLVLIGLFLFRLLRNSIQVTQALVLVTVAGSVGGIIATGLGFSFPAIYFLSGDLFSEWMCNPALFAGIVSGLVFVAGLYGFFLANLFEYQIIEKDKLPFPISIMIHEMVVAGAQVQKAYQLVGGFLATLIFCFLQDGLFWIKGVLPKSFQLLAPVTFAGVRIPAFVFDVWPMVWAIGFITGHMIAVPLAVGACAQVFILGPLNTWFFAALSPLESTFAFCSGMILLGLVESAIKVSSMMMQGCRWCSNWLSGLWHSDSKLSVWGFFKADNKEVDRQQFFGRSFEQLLLCCSVFVFLYCVGLSFLQIVYLLASTALFSYQMVVIGAKWGIVPLGRFATFIMLPVFFLFSFDGVQAIFVATFFEIAGGLSYDVLCGRVIGRRSDVDQASIKYYQYMGLLVSGLIIGLVFWLLIKSCVLGSAELCGYKAQSRSLLVNVVLHGNGFDIYMLSFGFLFSFLLTRLKLNPTLVLGGLLMPLNLSIGLIFGGLLAEVLTFFVKDRRKVEPFFSGVFTANSLWMLLKALI